ncbi:hypothetical protein NPIL_286151, partial [Nephila pilipes]
PALAAILKCEKVGREKIKSKCGKHALLAVLAAAGSAADVLRVTSTAACARRQANRNTAFAVYAMFGAPNVLQRYFRRIWRHKKGRCYLEVVHGSQGGRLFALCFGVSKDGMQRVLKRMPLHVLLQIYFHLN